MRVTERLHSVLASAARVAFVVASVVVLTNVEADAASILSVQGSTLGCFGVGCSDFETPAVSASVWGLTFTGAPFAVVTNGSGSAVNIVLGSLARANVNVDDNEPDLPFTLQVTFTLPTGIVGGQAETFTALISAKNSGGGGPLDFDFDNSWQRMDYANAVGSGWFDFSVTSDLDVAKNTRSVSVFGAIQNASFTPRTTTVNSPEPATLLLFTAGLGAAVIRRRRK